MKCEMKNCAKRLRNSSSDFFSSFAFDAFQNETRLCHLNGINKYVSEVLQLEKIRFEHTDKYFLFSYCFAKLFFDFSNFFYLQSDQRTLFVDERAAFNLVQL